MELVQTRTGASSTARARIARATEGVVAGYVHALAGAPGWRSRPHVAGAAESAAGGRDTASLVRAVADANARHADRARRSARRRDRAPHSRPMSRGFVLASSRTS